MADSGKQVVGRREFIKRSALAGLGIGLVPLGRAEASIETTPPQVRRYSELGRTGLRISDISFGGARLRLGQEDLVLHAYDRGINYFDTAETYMDGESETTIGNALRGKRDKVYITSKTITSPTDRRDRMMRALEGSLRRLQTDHVDIYFNHATNDVARLKNPEWLEFTDEARKQGKIRFVGMSGHAGRLTECLEYALDTGQIDVMLVAYNFGQDPRFYQRFLGGFDFVARQPDLPRMIEKAKSKNVGVVAMKTLMGARLNEMRPYERGGATFAQAAFRWVLSNPGVDSLIVTMTSQPMVDEFLGASGWRSTARADEKLLARYLALNSASQCRQGCGECESSCPSGVPIADVLRTRMYAKDYGDPRLARAEYSLLEGSAKACLSCSARPCADACPHGVPIAALTRATHLMLG